MKNKTKKITYTAITAALVFVVTWSVRFPVPATSGGYINFGDVIIFMSAFLLGGPLAAAAAALGSALADTVAGSVIYIPATFAIKGLMGLIFGYMTTKKTFPTYVIACVTGGAIMTIGYGLYELIVFGAAYAVVSLPFNLIQWAGSAIITIILFPVVKRLASIISIE